MLGMCRNANKPQARTWIILLGLSLAAVAMPASAEVSRCPSNPERMVFPVTVPPLSPAACPTTPNLPAPGQPILQTFRDPATSITIFLKEYRKELERRKWTEIKESKAKSGHVMYFLYANHPSGLKLKMMIHPLSHSDHEGAGAHLQYGNASAGLEVTVAIQSGDSKRGDSE